MKNNRISDGIPHTVFLSMTLITMIIILCFVLFVFYTAYPVIRSHGLINFITSDQWDYGKNMYGIRVFICGTLIVTFVTLLLAVPIGILTAIFLSEIAPANLVSVVRPLIELLVGIPSVVYGIFGLFVLEPIFRVVEPAIGNAFFFIPFLQAHSGRGDGVFLASIVLAVMVLPTIITISEDSMRAVANEFREASYAIGATKWETIRYVVLPGASSGIVSAIVLGMMRATGETMAVVMLIGGANQIPSSVFGYALPITTKILYDAADRIGLPGPTSAIFGLVAFLLVLNIFLVGVVGKLMKRRS